MQDFEIHKKNFLEQKSHLKYLTDYDYLFLGDSYFEFFLYEQYAGKNTFFKHFDRKRCLNLGVAGSTISDWLYYKEAYLDLPSFKNIFINLGYNDLHANVSVLDVLSHLEEFIKLLRSNFKIENIYVFDVTYSPCFKEYYEIEKEYNTLLSKKAKELNITVLSLNGKYNGLCFYEDLAHPNELGYLKFANILKSIIK